jgi:hypothetical protein
MGLSDQQMTGHSKYLWAAAAITKHSTIRNTRRRRPNLSRHRSIQSPLPYSEPESKADDRKWLDRVAFIDTALHPVAPNLEQMALKGTPGHCLGVR